MLPKPDTCKGCPMYGDGWGYVPDHLIPGSKVFILMQNPGDTEEQRGIPACGDTGKIMNDTFIPLSNLYRNTDVGADLNSSTVSVGNVLKCRWSESSGQKTNTLPTGHTLDEAVAHCTNAHLQIPDSTQVIVSQGSLAFNYITDGALEESDGKPSTSTDWRGWILPVLYEGRRVFQVGHLADLFRDPKQWWIATQDWRKLGQLLDGHYPVDIEPPDRIVVSTIEQWKAGFDWMQRAKASGKAIICDAEWGEYTDYLTIVGMAYRGDGGAIHGLQVDMRERGGMLRGQLAWQLRELVKTNPFVFHNAVADVSIFHKNLDIKYAAYKAIHDTMLAHSCLWGELPHSLDFVSSIYSCYKRLKHLSRIDQLLYNWGDVIATLCVYESLSQELAVDHGARQVYEQQLLPLIPVLLGAKKRGIRLNQPRILAAQPDLKRGMDEAIRIARVGSGRITFNLGSGDQLKDWCYRVKNYPLQRDKDTRRPTTDDDAIGVLREHVGPPFDPNTPLTVDMAIDRILHGADPVLEGRVLYVQTEHILNNYFYPLLKGVANARTQSDRKKCRQLYQSRCWRPADLLQRIFPDIATHIQKSGRHSTSNPPLAQLPAEYRDIIRPDKGCVWLKWDWSAIEPRLLEALCGSRILKRSFDEGIDLHTWTVCVVFNYPFPPDLVNPHKCKCGTGVCEHEQWRIAVNWTGKDDPRRVFAKQGRYEIWYGGTGSNAAASASRFGLDKRLLKSALQKLASSDPQYYEWRCAIESEVKRTRIIRSWGGRPRRFLGQGSGVVREALNHPMQAGVSDIYNLTIIEIARTYPQAEYMFGMHDSQWWSFKEAQLTREIYSGIKGIVEQRRNIHGVEREFPADFEICDTWCNYYGKSHDLSIEDWFQGARYHHMCGCRSCEGRIFGPDLEERYKDVDMVQLDSLCSNASCNVYSHVHAVQPMGQIK